MSSLIEEQKNQNTISLTNDIHKVALNAKQITSYTLQNIRSRCSVPYELTIPRKFANHDFNNFYASEYSFTALIAQPGYGKSILLSHLVQDIAYANDSIYAKDILCYFNANDIFDSDTYQSSLEDNIKSKIGLTQDTDLIQYFDEQYKKSTIRLILILDDFAELILNRYTKNKVFDRIVDLISAIGESNAIKIILSMRSTTWNLFFERIRHAHFLKRKWFPGSYYYLDYNSNIPPLSEEELEHVIEKMDPGNFEKISTNLKSQLKFPFHIQWYYRLKEQYPSFNFYTNFVFYEIIYLFINEKIFSSNYSTEKVLLIKQIVKLSDNSKKGTKLLKTDLMYHISNYKNAYLELLADGILMEEKDFYDSYPLEFVRFIHPHVFEYFLFKELLELHQHQMDKAFFEYLNEGHFSNEVRFQLLQWAIRQLIILGNLKNIICVFTLNLTNYEKNYLIYFIAENLAYRSLHHPEILKQIEQQNFHKILIHELVHFDFVDSCYKDAIKCLLIVANNKEIALFYHSILAIIDCSSFDQSKIAIRLEEMESLKDAQINTIFNPYELVNLIYLKLKGTPVSPTDVTLLKMEQFKENNIELNVDDRPFPLPENFIEYLLIILLNTFYGTQRNVITIVNVILSHYPKLITTRNSFSIYLLNILALANSRINPGKKTDQMERIIIKIHENKRDKSTLYAQSLLLLLKAQQKKNKKEYNEVISLAQEGIIIFERNNLFMYEMFMYNLLISSYTELHDFEKVNYFNSTKHILLENKKIPLLFLEYIDFT
ncbi:MAG: hypothetical protein H7202_04710 [Pedobacter sp.]|nr:hypothetical protein [Pedobacter sp.]